MTDDEIRDYLERHTFNGAASRLNRAGRDFVDALKATREVTIVYRLLCRLASDLSTQLRRKVRG